MFHQITDAVLTDPNQNLGIQISLVDEESSPEWLPGISTLQLE